MTENKGPFVEPKDVIEDIGMWIYKNYRTKAAAAEAIGMTAPEISNALNGKITIPEKLLEAAGYQRFSKQVWTHQYLKIGDDDEK